MNLNLQKLIKKLKQILSVDYRHYICIAITISFLLLSIFYFKYAFPRLLESFKDNIDEIEYNNFTDLGMAFYDNYAKALDAIRTKEFISFVKSNKEYKQTIIMITHNMEIAKCADRIIKIEDGKIVKEE